MAVAAEAAVAAAAEAAAEGVAIGTERTRMETHYQNVLTATNRPRTRPTIVSA
jgi:hypothetical protein